MASQPAARSGAVSRLRGAHLASAAQASARASVSTPRPPIVKAATNPYLLRDGEEGDDTAPKLPYSARYERRSRASRLGNKRMGLVKLPDALQEAVEGMVAASDKTLLRTDYLRHRTHLSGSLESFGSSKPLPSARAALLHLTSSSPGRYSALLNVLQEVKQRLSPPLPYTTIPIGPEEAGALHQDTGWQPLKVVEYGAAAAEGLWAAAEAFGTPTTATGADAMPGSLQEYEGIESRVPLLRVGMDLALSATEGAAPQLVHTPQEDAAENDEGLEYDDPDDDDVHNVISTSLSSVHKSFRSKRGGVSLSGKLSGPSPSTPADASGTLALSSFAMASMPSDTARRQHINSLWSSGAHTIVIVERGDARGFSCIASARAELLELGKEETQPSNFRSGEILRIGKHVFLEESTVEDNQGEATLEERAVNPSAGCHVVAPCPHDRPCPLLNPFVPEAVSSAPRSRPQGFATCSFSQRVQRPGYTRKTKHGGQSDEDMVYSYVVIRRGQRPSFSTLGTSATATSAGDSTTTALSAMPDKRSDDVATRDLWRKLWRAAARRTKEGDLDALRTGTVISDESASSGGPPLRVLEEVLDELSANEAEDDEARRQILELLPNILRSEAAQEGVELNEEDLQHAMREAMSPRDEPTLSATREAQSGAQPASGTPSDSTADMIESHPSDVDFLSPPVESAAMTLASYTWPRLIKPPLKKGGHVTFDACCASGDIQRFTVAKSAGRQPYQDARKASWGDLFPHGPATAEEELGDAGEGRGIPGKATVRIPPASDVLLATAIDRAKGLRPLSGAAARAAERSEDLAVEEEEKAEARALGWQEDGALDEEDDDDGADDLWLSDEEVLQREEASLAKELGTHSNERGAAAATAHDAATRPPESFTRLDLPESSMIGPDALSIPLAPPLPDGTPRRNAVERDARTLSDVSNREKRRRRPAKYTTRDVGEEADSGREAGRRRRERKQVRESRKMSRGNLDPEW